MTKQHLKIGIILDTSFDINDGVQQYVMSIGEWLRLQGHDVHYLVGETKDRDLPNIHSLSKNVSLRFNGNRMTVPLWAHTSRIRRLLAAEQFDVLHVQTPHHPLLAQRIIMAAPETTAVIATFHILPYGLGARYANRLLRYVLAPSIRRIDSMLAVSPAAATFAEWSFGRPATVLPNVFDYPRFAHAEPLQQYADQTKTILFFGRLVERKGCKYLLEAVKLLDRNVLPPFRVVVCGKGEHMSALQAYVADSGMQDFVQFVGYVSEQDKPRYYASADVSVFPSTGGESFGIVLLEAMASGSAAVLAGNNPGYASVMEPKPETLFTPQDVRSLADKIEHLLCDDHDRTGLAAWGRTYTKRFDVSAVGPELVDCYQKIIAKKQQNRNNDN